MRKRYFSRGGKLVEIVNELPGSRGLMIIQDLPAYESPIDGRIVEGRVARRNDLARSNSRPWEGLEAEKKEAARQVSYAEEKLDRKVDDTLHRAYNQIPIDVRKEIEGR